MFFSGYFLWFVGLAVASGLVVTVLLATIRVRKGLARTMPQPFRGGQNMHGLVWVVVLGDFGRSPRMQYHAVSLAQQAGKEVHVLAFSGSKPIQAVCEDPAIVLHTIPDPPMALQSLPRSLAMALKALVQTFMLLVLMLLRMPQPSAILLQDPPAIPVMALCWLAARWHHARFVIDWHNFGFTLMSLSMGRRHALVRLAERFERFWGRRSHANLCVTQAMQQELHTSWGISAKVFYDRPPAHFRPASLAERHDLMLRLANVISTPMHRIDWCAGSCTPAGGIPAWLQDMLANGHGTSASTGTANGASQQPTDATSTPARQTRSQTRRMAPALDGPSDSSATSQPAHADMSNGASSISIAHQPLADSSPSAEFSITTVSLPGTPPQLRPDRPAVLVSSTSWTPDEDFSILLDAACIYDAQVARRHTGCPKLLIFVTGKGPQKAMYRARMRQLDLRHVAIHTVWLEPEDYAGLLGSADLGISLHTSSSGLDLPMKVVDMFGCGLPVCAAAYNCINELVAHEQNGMLFTTAQELADHWMHLLHGFPNALKLQEMRKHVLASGAVGWSDSWAKVVKPLFA